MIKELGEVSEWLIEPVSKTGVPVRVPRVRIPPSPIYSLCVMRIAQREMRNTIFSLEVVSNAGSAGTI